MQANDFYSVEINGSLIEDYQTNLSLLYTPLTSLNAIATYMLLVAQAKKNLSISFDNLCMLSRNDFETLQKSMNQLEQTGLLKTYKKNDFYLLKLYSPLSIVDFLKHDLYSRAYFDTVGVEQYELVKDRLMMESTDVSDFVDISKRFDKSKLINWNETDEQVYQQLKVIDYQDKSFSFDMTQFLRNTSELIFPSALRTRENLDFISSIGTTFAINEERMNVHLSKSIDYSAYTIDLEKLRKRCIADKQVNIKQGDNKYDCSPVVFLYRIQNVPVSSSDKRLIESLLNEYHLPVEVVNVLIETTLNNTDNKLSKNYVEKLASEWARQSIDTVEKALNASKYEAGSTKKNKIVYTKDEMEVQQADIEAIRKRLFSKG